MRQSQANALLLLAAFLWGASNVAQKTVLADLGPLTTVGLRCLIGAMAILPFVRREIRLRELLPRQDWTGIVVTGLLFTGAITIQQAAYAATSVTNGSFLISTTTVMTPLASYLLMRNGLAPGIVPSVALGIAGALLMSSGSPTAATWGDLGCLVSAAFYSLWFVVLGRVVVRTRRPGFLTLAQFVITGGFCLTIGGLVEPVTLQRLHGAAPEIVFLGVFATGFAFGLQAIAQQYTSASTAAILTSAESVFGAACGCLVLGESLSIAAGIGALLIIASIIVVQIDRPCAMKLIRLRLRHTPGTKKSRIAGRM